MKRNLLLDPDPPSAQGGGANPPGNQNPPTTYSPDQLHAAVEKARLEEREKLRKQQADAEALAATNKEAAEKAAAEVARLNSALEAIEKAKTAGGGVVDIKALIQEVSSAVRKESSEITAKQREELESRINALSKDLTVLQLKELRTKLIAEKNGEVVHALIHGETEDALRASVEMAHTAYMEVKNQVAGSPNAGTANSNGNNRVNAPPSINPQPAAGARGSDLVSRARELTPTEYKENREKIIQDLKRKHG